MDALDESLKNEDQIIQDSYTTIAANTELLAQNLSDIADKYGITLSDSVTKPWLDGADAIGTYQGQLDTSMSAFTEQLKLLKQELIDLQVEADKTANSIINATNSKKTRQKVQDILHRYQHSSQVHHLHQHQQYQSHHQRVRL